MVSDDTDGSGFCLLLGAVDDELEPGVQLRFDRLPVGEVSLGVFTQHLFLLFSVYKSRLTQALSKCLYRLHLKFAPSLPAYLWPKPAVTHEVLRMKQDSDCTTSIYQRDCTLLFNT